MPALKANALPMPGLLWGAYPESPRKKRRGPGLAAWPKLAWDALSRTWEDPRQRRFLAHVREREADLQGLDVAGFDAAVRALRIDFHRDGLRREHLAAAFALVSEACGRTLGMRLYDTQLVAARIVLDNRLAEMATGEGKTLAVAAAAAAAGLTGMPVHVITANDYLVARDAASLQPVYSLLGLSVGAVTQDMSPPQRRDAYACDIAYCTAKELVFDYLRDGLGRTRDRLRWHVEQVCGSGQDMPLLRGLCMAIIDEADSILIDEARVPLILSRPVPNGQERDYLGQSLALARNLREGRDFGLDRTSRSVELTVAGRERLEKAAAGLGAIWRNRLHREETAGLALAALHLYRADRDYLVRAGQVHIIDETTGRIAPGRAWSRGLHQLIEMKEACEPTAPTVTAAQITYQRFFPRYLRLGGLSGTLSESRAELLAVYGLPVRRVPLRRPDQRRVLPSRLFHDRKALRDAVADRVAEIQRSGRPVLLGNESVADSEALSERLTAAGLEHAVLNARQDGAEAHIVAQAGQPGRITVTTNMAGRGTDIPLAPGVAERGGLHVISCQLNAARRIDRQLAGRCARQGDPGSVETWLSLHSVLLRRTCPDWLIAWLRPRTLRLGSPLVRALGGILQRWEERRLYLHRRRLLEHDKQMDRRLSFGGPLE